MAGTTAAPARPLLEVADVDVVLGRGWRANHVLSGVNLKVWPGEIIGLVGETGSGKTTLARTVVGLATAARRPGPVRRHGDLGPARRRPAQGAPHRAHPAGLPGPAALARPGPDRRGHRRRGPADPRRPVRRRDRGPRRGRARQGRTRRGAAAPAARADLRRPAAAGLDRPGPGGRPEAAAVRRAGQRARRQQQELHPAAARRAARQPRPADRDHLARPVLAGRHRRPGGGALPGPDRRGRPGGPGVHPAAPPVYRAADGFGAQRQARQGALGPPAPPDHRRSRAAAGAGACVFAARCPFAIDACAVQPPLEPVADQAAGRWSAACHRHEEWPALARERSRGRGPRSYDARKKSPQHQEGTHPCPSSSSA